MDYLVKGKIIIDVETEISASIEEDALRKAKEKYKFDFDLSWDIENNNVEQHLSVGEIID